MEQRQFRDTGTPDSAQRAEALDPERSFVVQAPAGSGKTELLMQRFLLLLSGVERPEHILAMTFTRKAAGEMQRRVVDALRAAGKGHEAERPHEALTLSLAKRALEQDRKKGWSILLNPGRLKILTIDSFSASLVRHMPISSLVGGEPRINEGAEEPYAVAVERTVSMIEGDGENARLVSSALSHMDNSMQALSKRLIAMLKAREGWLLRLQGATDDKGVRERFEGAFEGLVEYELGLLRASIPSCLEKDIVWLCSYAGGNLSDSPISCLSGLKALPGSKADDLRVWKAIKEVFLTKENEWRKTVNARNGFPANDRQRKTEFTGLVDELKGHDEVLRRFASIDALPCPRFEEEDWDALSTVIRLLPVADSSLKDVFRERGETDFQAVAMAALASLGPDDSPTDLMLSMDARIRHILVDEYQDTSRTQHLLLKALTRGWEPGDGRTVFIVGDPMQSIYGFRDSLVGLYLDARVNGLNGLRLAPLTLCSNFRSGKGVVEWVNSAFNEAFPKTEDEFTGSVQYAPGVAFREDMRDSGVCVSLYNGRDDEAEARDVISIIKKIPANEGIAVLCRERRHLDRIIHGLKANGMEFRASEFDRVSERPLIQDLLTITRAVLHPFNRVAWLALLRARWCGLTLPDLLRLCLNSAKDPVWTLLNDEDRVSPLSKDGKERVLKFRGLMALAMETRGRVSLRALIEGLWTGLGGPACVDDPSEIKDAQVFFDELSALEGRVGHDIEGSLLQRLGTIYGDYSSNISANIELMTIHRAKGLEFDHVIIPGLGRRPGPAEKSILLSRDWKDNVLIAPVERRGGQRQGPHYEYLKTIEREASLLEATRVFYVACTRPRKRLYLLGHVKAIGEDGLTVEAGSFLSSIRHCLNKDMVKGNGMDAVTQEEASLERPALRLKRLSLGWQAPHMPPALEIAGKAGVPSPDASPKFYWAGAGIRHLGTVVHRYLSCIAKDGLVGWDKPRIKGEEDRICSILRGIGLNKAHARDIAGRAVSMLSLVLDDGKGRWVLSGHKEGASELPLTGLIDNEIAHVVIDRTFVDEDGVRWVIDYKTGVHKGGDIDGFILSEKERYSPQLERYKKILKQMHPDREIRKGLYFPALLKWVEVMD